jgi:hypothetical protein
MDIRQLIVDFRPDLGEGYYALVPVILGCALGDFQKDAKLLIVQPGLCGGSGGSYMLTAFAHSVS